MTAESTKDGEAPDLLLVEGPAPDGAGHRVVRRRADRLEVGSLLPLVHGRPIEGEVVTLTPRPEHPRLFEVKTECVATAKQALDRLHAGPARVSTERYRDGWESIWGADRSEDPADLN